MFLILTGIETFSNRNRKNIFAPVSTRKINNFIKEYLTFSRKERRGVVVLFVVLCLMVFLLIFKDIYIVKKEIADSDMDSVAQDFLNSASFKTEIKKTQDKSGNSYGFNGKENEKPPLISMFSFNPNDLPAEKWRELGIAEWQIKALHRYEAKGGSFKSKDHFKKFSCISEKDYLRLEPFILLPQKKINSYDSLAAKTRYAEKVRAVVELNSANQEELKKIIGIGDVLSLRIIEYRKKLQGFVSQKQLLEVYGIDSSRFSELANQVIIDTSKINKIDINTCTVDDLKRHPYIKWNIANVIVNYRVQHGLYKSITEIKNTEIIADDLFQKLSNYLTIGSNNL